MPDPWETEYLNIVQESRQRTISQMSQSASRSIADEFGRQIARLEARIAEETIDAERARRLITEFEDLMIQYGDAAEATGKDLARKTIGSATEAHQEAVRGAASEVGAGVETPSFDRVNTRAFEGMYIRRGLDVTDSFKTLTRFSAEASAEIVEDALQDAIAGGLTPEEATNRIMRGLVQGDEELEAAVRRFGPRGGLRFGETGPINKATQDLARRIGHNARRIAVTEVASAYWEGDRVAGVESPVVQAGEWTLSASHPRADICDTFATADPYDMGEGVYPLESIPQKPHPFDLCSINFVFWRPENWGSQLEFSAPRPISESEVGRTLVEAGGSPTARQIERTKETFNGLNDMGYRYHTGELNAR